MARSRSESFATRCRWVNFRAKQQPGGQVPLRLLIPYTPWLHPSMQPLFNHVLGDLAEDGIGCGSPGLFLLFLAGLGIYQNQSVAKDDRRTSFVRIVLSVCPQRRASAAPQAPSVVRILSGLFPIHAGLQHAVGAFRTGSFLFGCAHVDPPQSAPAWNLGNRRLELL